MGKLKNFISHITVHKKDKDLFIENELKFMGPGQKPGETLGAEKKDEPKRTRK